MRLGILMLAAVGAALSGCGDLGLSKKGSHGGSHAAAVAPPAEPTPKVRITTPARGSFLAPGAVAVEGTVTPAKAPIAGVTLAGQPVALDARGTFRGIVTLGEGLNVIEASAIDADGRRGGAAVGVLAGTFKPAFQEIEEAGSARVNEAALDAIGKIVEGAIWKTDFSALLQNFGWFHATNILWVGLDFQIHQVRFQRVRVSTDATPQGVVTQIAVDSPIVDGDCRTDWGLGAVSIDPVTLEADRAVLTALVTGSVNQTGTLDVSIRNPALSFQNFRVTRSGGLLGVVAGVLPSLVEAEVRGCLVGALSNEVPPFVSKVLAEKVLQPAPFDVWGKQFAPLLRVKSFQLDDRGATVRVGFDAITGPFTARAQAAPGSYVTPGSLAAPVTSRGFLASIDDDALNRAAYVAWAGGHFDFDIDAAFLAKTGLPLPFDLDVGSIRRFVPEVGGRIPDSTPIMLRIESGLPPIAEVTGFPDLATMQVGEVSLAILVDRGSGWELLVRTVVNARFGLGLGFEQTGLRVNSVSSPQLWVDVVEEPIMEIDDRRLEALMTVIFTPAIPYLLNNLPVLTIPQWNQLTSANVFVFKDSAGVGVEGDLVR